MFPALVPNGVPTNDASIATSRSYTTLTVSLNTVSTRVLSVVPLFSDQLTPKLEAGGRASRG